MKIRSQKDIQSPKLENVSSPHLLQDMFCDKPALGDFFIKRKHGDVCVKPSAGTSFIKINPVFISNLTLEEKRAFALLLKLKKYSSHGRIWNYDPCSLSSEISISKYCLQKYVKILLDKRYCYKNRQGDLVLLSLDKIMKSKRVSRVIVSSNDSINNIVDKINYSVLKFSISQQDFIRRIKRNEREAKDTKYYNPSNLSRSEVSEFLNERRACAKIVKDSGIKVRGEFLNYNVFGIRKLSKLLNCSTKKAACLLNVLSVNNVIKTKQRIVISGISNGRFFNEDLHKYQISKELGYCFSVGRFIYRHLGTEILLSEFTK